MQGAIPVLITVTGADQIGDHITLSTRGALHTRAEGWSLQYEETGPDDIIPTQTLVECREDSVSVYRAGGIVSTMQYRQNETYMGEYQTPMGDFSLRVFSTEVESKRRGSMGHIRLAFEATLSTSGMNDGEMTMRTLDIRFRPCK